MRLPLAPFPYPDRFIQLQCLSICWVTAFLPGREERSPASPRNQPLARVQTMCH